MENNNKIRVEKYLDNDMTVEEKNVFESQLIHDETLQKELALQQDMSAALRAEKKAKLKKELSGRWTTLPIESEQKQKTLTIRSMRKWWMSAAAVLLLILAGIFIYQNTTSSETLLANYLEAGYSAPSVSRDQVGAQDDEWILAAKAFQNKQFTVAAPLIEKDIADGNRTIEKEFYLGLSYLFQKPAQTDNAITSLSQVAASRNIDFIDQANWFLALAYLKNKEPASARSLLEQIVSQKKWKHEEARQLLKD